MFYSKIRSKFLFRPVHSIFIVFVMLFFGGCGTTKVVKMIEPPSKPTLDMGKFIAPETHLKRFVAKGDTNSILKDNVIVKVADITAQIKDSRFSTEIDGPDGNKYLVSVSPMMLVLQIENGTDHIITLKRTIIVIEDENQHEYPLINSLQESKTKLITRVSGAFDKYLEDASAEYKKSVNGEYSEKHKRFSNELRTAAGKSLGASFGDVLVVGLIGGTSSNIASVRTSDMEKGKVLTEYGLNKKIEETSSANVYAQGYRHLQSEIMTFKSKAIQKISNQIQISAKNMITGGAYMPISILPKRTAKIVVPFSNPNPDKEITSLMIGLYDLPTKVNQAGDPVKRENFIFKMVATN